MLRSTYIACTVPCYVRLLCTSTVCSVLSVIMCSSALILSSFSGNCSAGWDTASLQYTCTEGPEPIRRTTKYCTHVRVTTCFIRFLGKRRENIWLKTVKEKWLEEKRIYLFSRLYDVSTSSCVHLTIIVSSSSICLCHSSLLPLIPFPPSVI